MHATQFHCKPIPEVVASLKTDPGPGLSQQAAEERLRRLGPNELTECAPPGFLALPRDQFTNYLVVILLIAAAISLLLGEYVDSVAILCIVVLNAVVGVVQESGAEQALAALKKLAARTAQVIRDGRERTIAGRELVPGDIVAREAGMAARTCVPRARSL